MRSAASSSTRSAADFVPKKLHAPLPQLRRAAESCQGCDLFKNATQVVFGERGDAADIKVPTAEIMLIGEQPGDQEDLAGHPFVGPAGGLLDKALEEAGIDRAEAYITNAVKHFKWAPAPRGKRRMHVKPSAGEVRACKPWLEREIALVRPKVIVCLGATAGQALLGSTFRVGAMRGKAIPGEFGGWNGVFVATIHPSAILRAPTHEDRDAAYHGLVADLQRAAKAAKSASAARTVSR